MTIFTRKLTRKFSNGVNMAASNHCVLRLCTVTLLVLFVCVIWTSPCQAAGVATPCLFFSGAVDPYGGALLKTMRLGLRGGGGGAAPALRVEGSTLKFGERDVLERMCSMLGPDERPCSTHIMFLSLHAQRERETHELSVGELCVRQQPCFCISLDHHFLLKCI